MLKPTLQKIEEEYVSSSIFTGGCNTGAHDVMGKLLIKEITLE